MMGRGRPGLENIPPLPDPRTGKVEIGELTPHMYLASLYDFGDVHAMVHVPVTTRPMTPEYAAIYQQSMELHNRLNAIAEEIASLHKSYTAPADGAAVAALLNGATLEAASDSIEDRASKLDRDARLIAATLPQLAMRAHEQARKDAAAMQRPAHAAYLEADTAHAAVESKVAAKRAKLEEAYRRGLVECEAMLVDTRRELLEAAWDHAWASGLPNTAIHDVDYALAEALLIDKRPSSQGQAEPEPEKRPAGYVPTISDGSGY